MQKNVFVFIFKCFQNSKNQKPQTYCKSTFWSIAIEPSILAGNETWGGHVKIEISMFRVSNRDFHNENLFRWSMRATFNLWSWWFEWLTNKVAHLRNFWICYVMLLMLLKMTQFATPTLTLSPFWIWSQKTKLCGISAQVRMKAGKMMKSRKALMEP